MSQPGQPRNRSKALVRFEEREGSKVAVKDCSGLPLWLRVLHARPGLRREERVYRRLAGLEGIPRLFGIEGRDRLVLEQVEGVPLSRWEPRQVPAVALDRLDALLEQTHRRGVAIADLHRSNVLVATDGRLWLVDFALARIARRADRPGLLVRALFWLDLHAAARIRARCSGTAPPAPVGLPGRLYRLGRRVKSLLRR